jgi:methyl-accepting chemotaxis protein
MKLGTIFHLTALGKKFLFPTMILIMSLLTILSFLLIKQYDSSFTSMMETRGNSTASFLAEASVQYYLTYDFESLDGFVLELMKDKGIAYVAFFDSKEKLFTKNTPQIKDFSNLLLFQQQISSADSQLGTVKIAYRKDILEANQKKSINTVVLTATIGLILLGLMITLVTHNISGKLQQIVVPLKKMGGVLTISSKQLSSISDSLSSSVNITASSLEETVSSVEELSSIVDQTAKNTNKATEHSRLSQVAAKKGQDEIDHLITAMQGISQSSSKVEEIISVIENIAFQTNLLALNAAVEAARAGDQGRGFAVVAEAVRTLAQKSTTAAKEITSLIQASSDEVNKGASIADQGANALKEIVVSSQIVLELNASAATISKEHVTGFQQIGQALNMIDTNTQSSAALAEEASSSATDVSEQSKKLEHLVEQLVALAGGPRRV